MSELFIRALVRTVLAWASAWHSPARPSAAEIAEARAYGIGEAEYLRMWEHARKAGAGRSAHAVVLAADAHAALLSPRPLNHRGQTR
ncbi:hypothetical protein AB0L00_22910 [Actinoallomurus sp. NPDC052308]|uniref:hypothetical protein n=1 Tax=Actinoallomurus sp. NPDC052308 TaxID=3155530 RepID=UPI0034252BC6